MLARPSAPEMVCGSENIWGPARFPADRAERLKELEVWPEEKFWPAKNKHATGIPFSHVPSQERLKELGILVPDGLYEAWTHERDDLVYHLGGSQFAIGKREVDAKIKNLATERLLAEGLPGATVGAAVSKIRPGFKIVSPKMTCRFFSDHPRRSWRPEGRLGLSGIGRVARGNARSPEYHQLWLSRHHGIALLPQLMLGLPRLAYAPRLPRRRALAPEVLRLGSEHRQLRGSEEPV